METRILARNLHLTDDIMKLISRRVQFAFARFAKRIRTLRVRLDDLNADRGGVDKRCVVEAELADGDCVRVDATDDAVELAVARAVKMASGKLSREVDRRRDRRRR